MKKKLILVASPPACGKTYVSQRIARSAEHMVYLDKDDLCELLGAAFKVSGNPVDMDGAFYAENLRAAEYTTILNIAFSALRFADAVLLNAPFGKEVRDIDYMRTLKEKANSLGAELLLIWVAVPVDLWRERMQKRGCGRDTHKLENWEAYSKTVDHTPPRQLVRENGVDGFFIFRNEDDAAVEQSLKEVMKRILAD